MNKVEKHVLEKIEDESGLRGDIEGLIVNQLFKSRKFRHLARYDNSKDGHNELVVEIWSDIYCILNEALGG